MQAGITAQGRPYVSGGIGDRELRELRATREAYSLWVVTAAAKSGAYLADVKVTIRDTRQQVVFDELLDGPWLFIDLPRGRFEVEARFNGETHKRSTTVHALGT